jgi:hypothetical protein
MIPLTSEVKKEIRQSKPLLTKLYQATSRHFRNKILCASTDAEIDTVIKVMHYIANKEITLAEEKKEKLVKGRRMPFIKKNFTSDNDIDALLKSPREKKIQVLRSVGNYGDLFHNLFRD